MKNFHLLLICIVLIVCLASCNKETKEDDNKSNVNITELIEKNLEKITIGNGLSGTVYQVEGNCMPIIDENSTCKTFPIKRKILVYEYTTTSQLIGTGTSYESILTQKIAETESDSEGFYEINLGPGIYSIFVFEKGNYYANNFDGNGGIHPVEIIADSLSLEHLSLDYAVY